MSDEENSARRLRLLRFLHALERSRIDLLSQLETTEQLITAARERVNNLRPADLIQPDETSDSGESSESSTASNSDVSAISGEASTTGFEVSH